MKTQVKKFSVRKNLIETKNTKKKKEQERKKWKGARSTFDINLQSYKRQIFCNNIKTLLLQ